LQLRRRCICGPFQTAVATLNHLRNVTGRGKWNDVNELLAFIKKLGRRLVEAQPLEMAIASMVGRVLHFIRDCHRAHMEERGQGLGFLANISDAERSGSRSHTGMLRQKSLKDFMLEPEWVSSPSSAVEGGVKTELMRMLTDFRDELLSVQEEIEKQAPEYIHDQSVILTMGASASVQSFLCAAASKGLRFHVIILEGDPQPRRGHSLAALLTKEGRGVPDRPARPTEC